MTRRDYQRAAEIIRALHPTLQSGDFSRQTRDVSFAYARESFVSFFHENPMFNAVKFREACEPVTSVRPTGGTEVSRSKEKPRDPNESRRAARATLVAKRDKENPQSRSALSSCDGCGKKRRDVRSVGRDANGDPDAPDLCFLCRKKGRSTVRAKGPDGLYVVVD